jgi:hypothetical protein
MASARPARGEARRLDELLHRFGICISGGGGALDLHLRRRRRLPWCSVVDSEQENEPW